MPLAPGTRIASYEILGAIGAGGMGEVCRARDLKLDREVAIKILPAEFAKDRERLTRFEREAKVLAALNHPNIAQIYGLEESNEGPALVMELIRGETIRGPVPEEQALGYARQIAAALEAAHEKGIVHRDLKPANIMLTADGVIKLLDFGIATVIRADSNDPSNAPTLTLGATSMGLIVGTAGYMSPEQASGKPVDKRADIFSFGVVLYELITGKRLFDGETVSHTLAAVLTQHPDLSAIPPTARILIQRCLEKDPKRRLRDIGDAFLVEPVVPQQMRSRWLIPAMAAGVLSAGLIGWFARPIPTPPDLPVRTFSIPISGPLSVLSSSLMLTQAAISPNGKYIAHMMSNKLWIRDLAVDQARAIEGTDGPTVIFWSPDSKRVGFAQRQNLKTVALDGGLPEFVFSFGSSIQGAAWSPDGRTIAVSTTAGTLMQVPAAGGGATPIPRPTGESGAFHSLSFLPSAKGERLLLASQTIGGTNNQSMMVINLDNGAVRKLGNGNYPISAGNGFILFQSEAGLGPLRMLKLSSGTQVPEGEAITALPSAWRPTVSSEGTLVWMDPAFDSIGNRQLVWRDRAGNRVAVAGGGEQALQSLELSPDGGRVAFSASEGVNRDVWVLDLARSVRTRLTNDPDFDGAPVWAPTGKEIAFRSNRSGGGDIFVQAADGGSAALAVVTGPTYDFPRSWSPDGQTILFVRQDASSSQDVWSTRRKPDGSFAEPVPFLQSKGNENVPGFSPDGRFVVYTSDESGRPEVYVRAFPGGGERWQISGSGGNYPRWSRNGKEIFFLKGSAMMAVAVSLQAAFRAGAEVELFQQPGLDGVFAPFDVTADGKRFLISEHIDSPGTKTQSIHVIQNWRGLIKQERDTSAVVGTGSSSSLQIWNGVP